MSNKFEFLFRQRIIAKHFATALFVIAVITAVGVHGFFKASAEEGEDDSKEEVSTVTNQEIIEELQGILPLLSQVSGVVYQWNSDNSDVRRFGFVPSKLEKVFPELVTTYSNGDKSVNNVDLVPYIVTALSELEARVAKIEAKLSMEPETISRNEAVVPEVEEESGDVSTIDDVDEGTETETTEDDTETVDIETSDPEATEEDSAVIEEGSIEETEVVAEEEIIEDEVVGEAEVVEEIAEEESEPELVVEDFVSSE